jgi:hypothetical protein
MSQESTGGPNIPDAVLAKAAAKLWPHRLHESSPLLGLLCRARLHRWGQLNLKGLVPETKEVRVCRWCSKVKINGIVYDV